MTTETKAKPHNPIKPLEMISADASYLSKRRMILDMYVDTITIKDWIKTPPIIVNRNHELRVNKLKKVFSQKPDSLRVVAKAIVKKSFDIYDSDGDLCETVEPGEYRLDGNTRAEFWDQYPEFRLDDPLIVIKYYINSQEQLELEYDAHNNKFSSKNGADSISGAMRTLGLSYKNPRLAKGQIAQSLKYAMADDTATHLDSVKFFKDELKLIDDNNLLDFDKKMSGMQHLICAMLICLKTWKGSQQKRLIDGIIEFCRINDNQVTDSKANNGFRSIGTYMSGNRMNPLAIMWKEYYNGKDQTVLATQQHLTGIRGSSKYADMDQQLDFICYLMKKYVNSDFITDIGIKQANYDKTYNELADW
jgi:hypothetical protein